MQPASAEEAFKAWAYQRPTALCTPPKAVVKYMKAIYCISADALTKMQSVSAHAFEIGSMRREIEAVWSSYESFVEFFIDQVGIAPTIFHLVDWKRAMPLKMPAKQVGDWHAGDPVHEHNGYLVFPMRHCKELDAASMHEKWVHGTQFSSLWNIMAHGNVVASPGNADVPTGVWTTVKPVYLEGFYSCVSHIGLGVTARLSLLLRPLGRNAAEVFKRTEKQGVYWHPANAQARCRITSSCGTGWPKAAKQCWVCPGKEFAPFQAPSATYEADGITYNLLIVEGKPTWIQREWGSLGAAGPGGTRAQADRNLVDGTVLGRAPPKTDTAEEITMAASGRRSCPWRRTTRR